MNKVYYLRGVLAVVLLLVLVLGAIEVWFPGQTIRVDFTPPQPPPQPLVIRAALPPVPTPFTIVMTPEPVPTEDGTFFRAQGLEQTTGVTGTLVVSREGQEFVLLFTGLDSGCRADSHCRSVFTLVLDKDKGQGGLIQGEFDRTTPLLIRLTSLPGALQGKMPGPGSRIRLLVAEDHFDDGGVFYQRHEYTYHMVVQMMLPVPVPVG